MRKNIIKFRASDEAFLNTAFRPLPASKLIPEWWKKIPKYSFGNKIDLAPGANVTVKQCAPVFDSLSSGYILRIPIDLLIKRENGEVLINWLSVQGGVDLWSESQVAGYKVPVGYSETVFKLFNDWRIETPKGWSCLFIEPFGYQNSPIRPIPAIVDTDILKTPSDYFPFVVREDFEGIVPAGTPFVQIIPIKREAWQSKFDFMTELEVRERLLKFSAKIYKYYSSLRERKQYF